MLKKRKVTLISVLVCVLMLMQSITFAADSQPQAEFVYTSELEFISKLGITNVADFDPVLEVSRGDCATIVMKMLDFNQAKSHSVSFTDVNANAENYSDIQNAASMGIINGYPDSTFRPDEAITYMQFYKILVSALGYGEFAKVSGGYPVGYLKFVGELDLDDGITASYDSPVLWADAVCIIYNALNAGLCEADSVIVSGNETGLDYYINDDITLLTRYHGIYIESGVVEETAISALADADPACGEGEIIVNGKSYYGASAGDYDKLGYYVDLYYKNNNELFYVVINSMENDVQTYTDEEISDFDEATNTYEITIGERTRRVSLSKSVDVIVNEKACPLYDKSDMIPYCGEVCLIDNNSDGKTDVVKVTSYEHYCISGVDSYKGLIYSKNNSTPLNLDVNDGEVIVSVENDEDEFSYSMLKVGMIMSITISDNTEGVRLAKIYLSQDKAEGEISGISSDYKTLSLGGEVFNVDDGYVASLSEEDKKLIKPSEFVELKISAFGDVVYIDTDAVKGKNYGFILDVAAPKNSMDTYHKVRLLDAKAQIQIFNVEETLSFNHEKISASSLEAKLSYTFEPGDVTTIRQLVVYDISSNGILKSLETYEDFSKNLQTAYVRGVHFGKSSRLESDTPVFIIPNDANINTTDIESGFNVRNAGSFAADVGHKMEFFDYDELRIAGTAVKYEPFGSKTAEFDDEFPLTVITAATIASDKDGNDVQKIQGLTLGKPTEEILEDKFITYRDREGNIVQSYKPQEGDIIAYTTDINGNVNLLQLFYRRGQTGSKFIHSTHSAGRFDSILTVVGGEMIQFANGKDAVIQSTDLIVNAAVPEAVTVITPRGSFVGDVSDISIGDYVVCRLRYGNMKEYIVIRD